MSERGHLPAVSHGARHATVLLCIAAAPGLRFGEEAEIRMRRKDPQVSVRETIRMMVLEALRQGPQGARYDYALEGRPWGVPLAEIEVPVELWHGLDDRIASPEQGRIFAVALPDVSTHFVDGEGHLSIFVNRLDEISASVG